MPGGCSNVMYGHSVNNIVEVCVALSQAGVYNILIRMHELGQLSWYTNGATTSSQWAFLEHNSLVIWSHSGVQFQYIIILHCGTCSMAVCRCISGALGRWHVAMEQIRAVDIDFKLPQAFL